MSVPTLVKADNGYWYATWSDGRRSKRKSMGSQNQAAAKERFAHWLLIDGQEKGEDVSYTVSDLWMVYDEKHIQPNVTSKEAMDGAWKNLGPHFGHLTLPEVRGAVESYVAKRGRGDIGRKSKPSTIRKELVLLRACFNWCADPSEREPIIDTGQVPRYALPPPGEPKDRWLKPDEIQRVLAAAGGRRKGDRLSRVERFLWIALETAGRKTAILDLTWDRVDFETNVIHLRDPDQPVTNKRRASVPISKALRPILERAYSERDGHELVMDNKADVWATVQSVAYAAGFAPLRGPRGSDKNNRRATGISPHTLRHTAATHMARRGVPLWIIAKVLGNTLAMVERVYAKHCPDDLREAVNMISNGALEAAE